MERKRVSASKIRSVGYDAKAQILEIEFNSGAIYQYARVSAEVHRRLMNAPSAGSYFEDNIEESYTGTRVRG
jgi:KTSC domain